MFSCKKKDKVVSPTLDSLERQIFSQEGLIDEENLKIYDVKLERNEGWLHTVEAGFEDPNLPIIVFIHGYGGSSLVFWRVIAKLRTKYHIYAIDQYGTGRSARPQLKDFSYGNVVKFFTDPIEEWRVLVGLEEREFILAGHSFGGYTAFQYFRMYKPPNLKKLILISPGGFTFKSEQDIVKGSKMNWAVGKIFRTGFKLIHNYQWTPMTFQKIVGKKRSTKKFFKSNRLRLGDEVGEVMGEYFNMITDQPMSGDACLGVFLYFARYSKRPISKDFKVLQDEGALPPDVVIMYGSRDWMDFQHSKEVIEKEELNLRYLTVPDSGHQILFQNPDQLSRILLEELDIDHQKSLL